MPRFERDAEKEAGRRGDHIGKLEETIRLLRNRERLPNSYRDHALKGDWKGYLECHVGGEGDWLLIYICQKDTLILFRTGKHDELFQ